MDPSWEYKLQYPYLFTSPGGRSRLGSSVAAMYFSYNEPEDTAERLSGKGEQDDEETEGHKETEIKSEPVKETSSGSSDEDKVLIHSDAEEGEKVLKMIDRDILDDNAMKRKMDEIETARANARSIVTSSYRGNDKSALSQKGGGSRKRPASNKNTKAPRKWAKKATFTFN
jgi:hypothetical protein